MRRRLATTAGKDLDDPIDVLVGVVAAEAEADRAVDRREGDLHRPQHVRRLQRSGGAGRAAGGADARSRSVDRASPRLPRSGRRRSACWAAAGRRWPLTCTLGIVASMACSRRSRRPRTRVCSSSTCCGGQLHGLGQADDVGHVFRPRPAAFLLVPADQQRPAGRAAA